MSSNLRHHIPKRARPPNTVAALNDPDTSMDLDPALSRYDPALSRYDPLYHLPLELTYKILSLLTSRQLCMVCRVSQWWKKVVHIDLNPYWWGLCMEQFWQTHARPEYMTKAEKKRDWKNVWVDVLKKESKNRIMGLDSESSRKSSLHDDETVIPRWDDQPATKLEMRAHYKSIRSKPKGKKPEHVLREWDWE